MQKRNEPRQPESTFAHRTLTALKTTLQRGYKLVFVFVDPAVNAMALSLELENRLFRKKTVQLVSTCGLESMYSPLVENTLVDSIVSSHNLSDVVVMSDMFGVNFHTLNVFLKFALDGSRIVVVLGSYVIPCQMYFAHSVANMIPACAVEMGKVAQLHHAPFLDMYLRLASTCSIGKRERILPPEFTYYHGKAPCCKTSAGSSSNCKTIKRYVS